MALQFIAYHADITILKFTFVRAVFGTFPNFLSHPLLDFFFFFQMTSIIKQFLRTKQKTKDKKTRSGDISPTDLHQTEEDNKERGCMKYCGGSACLHGGVKV